MGIWGCRTVGGSHQSHLGRRHREMGERVAPSGQQALPRFFGSLSFILRIIVQNLKGKKRMTVSPARLYCDSGSNDKTNCNVCKI